ncbi:MAG: TetR/AcrR family transcriptional regulator [Bacteroidales bacterium]|nr:TetR/AcrR family transcriptional regulator [Bacteroidales bacterium]
MRVKDIHKVDLIYKSSLELIRTDGIAGLTMSKLARRAGLATGTLYIYFKSKEELLNTLYLKLNAESAERFMMGYDPEVSLQSSLKKVWLNYLKHRIEHYDESIFLEQYYRSPFISKDHLEKAESMKTPVHSLIRRGKEEGFIRDDVEDEMLFLAMLGFIRELADEHVTSVYELNKERIEKAFQLSWDTVRK